MPVQYESQHHDYYEYEDVENTQNINQPTSKDYILKIFLVIAISITGFTTKAIYQSIKDSFENITIDEVLPDLTVNDNEYQVFRDNQITDIAPEHYLSEADLYIYEESTGKRLDENFLLNSPRYTDYATSKGIHAGDTWEQFLDAYGEYYLDYATYFTGTEFTSISTQEITVREFHEQYIETGKAAVDDNSFYIQFSVMTNDKYYAYSTYDMVETNFLENVNNTYEFTHQRIYFSRDTNNQIRVDYVHSGFYYFGSNNNG